MAKRLRYQVKVDPQTGKIVGPDAARIREELREHYGGSFVVITIAGIAPEDEEYRGAYWASLLPHVARAWKNAGYQYDAQNRQHLEQIHDYVKKQFTENGTTKGMTAEQWREYMRTIENWLNEFFHYNTRENVQPK